MSLGVFLACISQCFNRVKPGKSCISRCISFLHFKKYTLWPFFLGIIVGFIQGFLTAFSLLLVGQADWLNNLYI